MAKRHDENKVLRSFSRIGRVNSVTKTLSAPKSAVIGIHMWGKIDYLTHYCGYHFVWDNSAFGSKVITNSDKKNKISKADKRESKAPKLTNKNKKK